MPAEAYRHAAAILVLRPAESAMAQPDAMEILLLHKPRKRDAWQLPQGGMEAGETVRQCALRELSEEAGLTDVTVIGESRHVYQYDFPSSFRRFRPDHIKGQYIRYIFALTSRNARIVEDGVEIDQHCWTLPAHLSRYIKREQYRTLVETLCAEAVTLLRRAP